MKKCPRPRRVLVGLLLLGGLLIVPGCAIFNYLAASLIPDPPPKEVDAEYKGLADRTVAVIVYADDGVQFAHRNTPEGMVYQLTCMIRNGLSANIPKCRVVDPRIIVRYQDQHRFDWVSKDRTALGKHFGADYVLYVSLTNFTTTEGGSQYLFRGDLLADASLYQCDKPERDARVWAATDMHVSFPKEAVNGDSDAIIRDFTLALFADQLTKKFYKHKVPVEKK